MEKDNKQREGEEEEDEKEFYSKSKSNKKLRSKILKILPKAAAAVAVTFQNSPFSPRHSATSASSRPKPNGHNSRGTPMIPDEARRKPKQGIEAQEPTSPKVSCIGQIKHKQRSKKHHQISIHNAKTMSLPALTTRTEEQADNKNKKKKGKMFQRMLFQTGKPTLSRNNSRAEFGDSDNKGPPIGYMRRFASGRDTFSNFDWKAQIAPEDDVRHRDCFSEDDRADDSDADAEEQDHEDHDEPIIPFSAPILGGKGTVLDNLQPRKEINLWKRRTMAPPTPLQLKPLLTAN